MFHKVLISEHLFDVTKKVTLNLQTKTCKIASGGKSINKKDMTVSFREGSSEGR